MAKNLNFYFDNQGVPRARGPYSEKVLMAFLEADVQGSDYVLHDLIEDITAIEDGSAEEREFIGNAHSVTIVREGITIEATQDDSDEEEYKTGLKHFREILEDWEAFIMDDQELT